MKRELAERLVEALEDHGSIVEFRPNYSGRGMMGESTAAVVVQGSLIELVEALVERPGYVLDPCGNGDPLFKTVRLSMDEMGRGTVIY